MFLSWKEINDKIIGLRAQYRGKELISQLHDFFNINNDGMIAFSIAEELAKMGNHKDAIEWCDEAETLFPKEEFKVKARKLKLELISILKDPKLISDIEEKSDSAATTETINNLKDLIRNYNPVDSLLIVSCTKPKVWDIIPGAPDIVFARYAYKGKKFIKFLQHAEDEEIEKKGFFWIILIAKYGFIESWHPIMRYDEKFGDNKYFPISDESLSNQTRQERQWRNKDGEIEKKRLIDFSKILPINCSTDYIKRIKICFKGKEIHQYEMKVNDY